MSAQERYDEAMHLYSMGEYDQAIGGLESILSDEPENFDARLALGMAYYRKGDYARAIEEGHKAEKLKPHEQLVHTNLSLFYMKSGDKATAEHHGLQARIASWKTPATNTPQPGNSDTGSELQMAKPPPPKPVKLPDMPWKKNKKEGH
ncbi:MAG: tetratricopeptide repeat protein [Verrucomicrobiota bacterium]